jgi:hypothetical protein
VALTEWHLTPEYINNNWTEELLALMMTARIDRLKRKANVKYHAPINDGKYHEEHHADASTLFGKMSGFGAMGLKVTKR